jgi:geranylgeranyl diphosphate synthase, type II
MLEHLKKSIEKEIGKQTFGVEPKSLYEPIRYLMKLGGKRLRPLLVLLAYSLYKKDVKKIVKYAVAVEAFHNFTLMHDDIMDKAPLRRGKATVHHKWNVNTAILSGDVMLVRVYDMFLSLEETKLKQVLKAFNKCAAEVCEGQQWDMEFETRSKVSEAQYIEMIRLKTAVLLGFSLELGAILADAPEQDQIALREFGINIGIGFQLKDDLLDVYADGKKFGKQVGGDIIANKKTLLLILALQSAKGNQKISLTKWIGAKKFNSDKKIKAVTEIYDSLSIAPITEAKIEYYFENGFSRLSSITKEKTTLEVFAKELIRRQV